MSGQKFKVLTLNCWGVVVGTKKKTERLTLIGQKLAEGYYDVILLQEIWTVADYEQMKKYLNGKYQYNHYFHSNVIGSGCCIFTKFRILSTFFYRFPANGFPHAFYHGDWLGGKGVGLAVLESPERRFIINVYVTHIHARYSHTRQGDSYFFHRTVQGYSMGEFIRLTSGSCDAVIAAGDFNMSPSLLGMRFVMDIAGLRDSWFSRPDGAEMKLKEAATCDRPDGLYHNKSWMKFHPEGERLDYIIYRQNAGIKFNCENCFLAMCDVPGRSDIQYSDHSGVEAHFDIQSSGLGQADPVNMEARGQLSREFLVYCDETQSRIRVRSWVELVFGLILMASVLSSGGWSDRLLGSYSGFLLLPMAIAAFCCIWYSFVFRASEDNSVRNMRQYLIQDLANSDDKLKNV